MISRLGSNSNSMYTFLLPLATLFTALISLRCSSAFKHLLICTQEHAAESVLVRLLS